MGVLCLGEILRCLWSLWISEILSKVTAVLVYDLFWFLVVESETLGFMFIVLCLVSSLTHPIRRCV